MKTLIAIPCMDQVAAGFCGSLATMNRVGEATVSMLCGSLVYDSRNKLCQQALKMGVDYILWLDSDMTFTPDLMEKMVKHMEDGKDIVTGLYFRRAHPFSPVIFSKLDKVTDEYCEWTNLEDYPEAEPFEIAGCGFGALMVNMKVVIDIALNYKTWFDPMCRVGEDLAFCLRARELGYKIWCDPTIKLGHMGQLLVTEDMYKATRKELKK